MTVLLTRSEMQALDRLAIDEIGIPSLVLMEVAGRAVADRAELAARAVPGGPGAILAVSGTGNNGGDAVVAARLLADRGLRVTLVLVGDAMRTSTELEAELHVAEQLHLAPLLVGAEEDVAELERLLAAHAVVIDGLFGTGLTRPISGLAARVVDAINAADRVVIAVNVPSGIDADTGRVLGTAIRAQATVTFQHAKLGHVIHPGREHTGELIVADIGIPRSLLARLTPSASWVTEADVVAALPPRRADSHKGTYGHLLVVAGAPDRPGAALLTGRAALRMGAGLVSLASDAETIRRLAPALDELMGVAVGEGAIDPARVLAELSTRSALAIGPSLASTAETAQLVRAVLSGSSVPAVVDAGGLAALGSDLGWLRARTAPTVLTPHPGEAARLAGVDTKSVQTDRVAAARALARESGAVVVLKGASTIVASPDRAERVAVVTGGNPGMATGGMGDVLTGVIGSLLAQGLDAEQAARVGVWLHAEAGDRAAVAGQPRLVASDLLMHLGRAR